MVKRLEDISASDIEGVTIVRCYCGYKPSPEHIKKTKYKYAKDESGFPKALSGEEWRYVDGFDRELIVSNLGRVARWTKAHGFRVLNQHSTSKGYQTVFYNKNGKLKTLRVHRLVAMTFIPGMSAERNQVNHKNLDKTDNRVENLEWVSGIENVHHYLRSVGKAIA